MHSREPGEVEKLVRWAGNLMFGLYGQPPTRGELRELLNECPRDKHTWEQNNALTAYRHLTQACRAALIRRVSEQNKRDYEAKERAQLADRMVAALCECPIEDPCEGSQTELEARWCQGMLLANAGAPTPAQDACSGPASAPSMPITT